jgi:hypothetical protein
VALRLKHALGPLLAETATWQEQPKAQANDSQSVSHEVHLLDNDFSKRSPHKNTTGPKERRSDISKKGYVLSACPRNPPKVLLISGGIAVPGEKRLFDLSYSHFEKVNPPF